jgi:2-desacetyl-2-hydroxyethyl bacteriochlorophyllide A dehydrogenase
MNAEVPTPNTSTPAGGAMMKAVVQDRYGSDPDELLLVGEVPQPAIGPHEVLVEVAAASVDRGTWHLMSGRPQLMRLMGFGFRRPKALNPGRSFAGTIVALGESVSGLHVGDAVYGTGEGSFAEYVAAAADKVARKPSNLSFEQAATVPVSAVTAIQAVRDVAKVKEGQRVLIIGASGGVGTFLVQLVKAFGGHVTAVASTAKLDMVRALGADEVIDYSRDDFADGRRTYDVILDTGGNRPLPEIRRALAPDGTLVIIGGETDGRWLGGFARNLRAMLRAPFVRGQRLRSLASKENAADLDALSALIEAGQVVPAVDRSYPLSETAAAIRRLTDGDAKGKIAITT